jgi:hypothetical protein
MILNLPPPIEFARSASDAQRAEERSMLRSVRLALRRYQRGEEDWSHALVEHAVRLYKARMRVEARIGDTRAATAAVERFRKEVTAALNKTTVPTDEELQARAEAIARSVSTAAINAATEDAADLDEDPDSLVKVWFSMEDDRVRPTHAAANGQSVPVGEKFTVGGHEMDHPGDMSAPIEEWINCRCVMSLVRTEAIAAAGTMDDTTTGDAMTITLAETGLPEEERVSVTEEVPWYGVLAPEDVMSGDGRKFAAGALRARDLPLPLSWQKTNEPGHDGSVVVGRIDEVWRKDGEMRGRGVFLSSVPETDEAIGLIAEGGIRGVSIDADDGTMELMHKDGRTLDEAMEALGEDEGIDLDDIYTVFTDARVCGATLCPIPAFMEAFVSLGVPPEEFLDDGSQSLGTGQEDLAASAFVSEKPWDGSASRFTPEQWYASCVLHRSSDKANKSDHSLPIKEPGGALSRAGVHAAAGRVNQTSATPEQKNAAKAKLRSAYSTLGEDPPDSIKASVEDIVLPTPKDVMAAARAFVKTEDGPGWLTHPVDTDRLRDYWVRGEGAAKIGWGTPGDFNRCRSHLAKYVKANHLSGYCANRHYDALGFWPAQHHSEVTLVASADTPALRFVHTDDRPKPPMGWFDDPHLIEPSPITVTEEGRVYGHLARWDTCHVGISGVCTVAPHSVSDYAYFRTGYVLTDDGPVPTGTLTLGKDEIGGHADKYANAAATIAHYDNTGYGVAYVAAGEDDHGIWVAGCVAPGTTSDQIIKMRASALSGDWREIGGNLELVAALHVNVQGFPIPHPSLAASGGRQVSLVAAGIIPPVVVVEHTEMTVEQIVARVLDEQARRAERAEAARRLHALAVQTGRDPASRIAAAKERVGI